MSSLKSNDGDEIFEISDTILDAQRSAESEVLEAEANFQNEIVAALPKFIEESGPDVGQLAVKTNELKQKGQQLDLLLLKAETYSHFIRENQERSKKKLEDGSFGAENKSPSNGKRKANVKSPADSKSKRGPLSPQEKENKDGFTVTTDLKGEMMAHQIEGLKWLLSLWENGLSGILADEMGLGKTIQIIALIGQLRSTGISGPFLIAGPLATLPNWMKEFAKWLPSCPTVLYHGSREERQQIRSTMMNVKNSKSLSFPVVITSFEICMIDRPFLDRYVWQYIILDEGHRIKNRNCKLVRELKQIQSVSRLLLTGTPIQNTLEELWSLLNFVNPMIFDNLEVFQSWFRFRNIGKETSVEEIIGEEQNDRIVSKLHEILRPFLLRRMKVDVMLNVPLKKEIVVYCGMSSLQRDYYTRVLEGTLRETLLSMGVDGASSISQINTNMNLRKVCNHPFLFGEPRDPISGQHIGEAFPHLLTLASGKFKLLDRMLPILKQQGHKVLIFSQMTQLLTILQDYLEHKGYQYRRLDGAVKIQDRQQSIEEYNANPDIFCFLLSTRAGGLGINLTAADTCIIFDSDWNPHCDSQAQDRCHRIGQTRNVVVYRLLTLDSVELEMMEKQISKKKLDRMTMHGGDFSVAGKRKSASQLTLSYLRQLLEDDVRSLAGRMSNAQEINDSSCSNMVNTSISMDISEKELDYIMNRELIFLDNLNDENGSTVSGDMFDMVSLVDTKLQGIS